MDEKICFATSNFHKFEEVSEIARSYGIMLEHCNIPKIEVQAESLREIVLKSAILTRLYTNKPVLVEDAGLFIKALNGFPGPYSNYVYRTIGINGVLKLLENIDNREACFKSAAALIHENGVIIDEGEVCGYIVRSPRGTMGFGFDPIFTPYGETKTFAEMTTSEKNKYSHRAKAISRVFEKYVELKRTI
ncbi:MAG: XTP/dITP diphosphatase [Desulfurococcaceae archaeon]|nr:XTP/dITP diphosphatase [Desulfurococcaceae archaeon]